ncbi:polysaccharide biosynthesis/export family protein [Planctomycetota bacterium]
MSSKHRIDLEKPEVFNADGIEIPENQAAWEYTIGIGDKLSVDVARHSEFCGEFVIGHDGVIILPITHDRLPVKGKTTSVLEADIGFALRRYFKREPIVRVDVLEVNSKRYMVLGDVNTPGFFYMSARETRLVDALIESGAQMTEHADLKRVYVISPDRYHPKYVKINGEAVMMGLHKENILIRDGDVVFVPKKLSTRVDEIVSYLLNRTGQVLNLDRDIQYLEDLVPHRSVTSGRSR